MTTQERIRVLIADADPAAAAGLRDTLALTGRAVVVGQVGSGREAILQSETLAPHVVLLSLILPDLDGITVAEQLQARRPTAQVVILAPEVNESQLRRALQAGAADFIRRTIDPEELSQSLVLAYQRSEKARSFIGTIQPTHAAPEVTSSKVITVFSPKGGTGKTMLATNLALALREYTNQPVALVDASLIFGDIGVMLNLPVQKSVIDLLPGIHDLDADSLNAIMVEHESGIRVLLAPPRPEMAELVTGEHFATIIQALRQIYAYIVIDTMSSFHEVNLTIFDQCDDLILLASSELTTIKSLKLSLETLEALAYAAKRTLLVLNHADSNTMRDITPQMIEQRLGTPIALTIVSDNRRGMPAVNHGIPLWISAPDSVIPRAIGELARTIIGDAPLLDAALGKKKKPTGLAGLLRR